MRHSCLLLPLAIFLWGAWTGIEAHGLYMDAVNPDYLVARLLGPARTEIIPWVLPGNLLLGRFPLLIQLYHGALPFWLGLPGYVLLGTDVSAVRMVHAGFGVLVLGGLYSFLLAFGVSRLAATAALCVLAFDPTLLLAFRTQFYITLLPFAFVLMSAALTETARWRWSLLASGFCAGLAVHGYFIHGAFFLVLMAQAVLRGPARGFCEWLLGAALAGSVYPLGVAAVLASSGQWAAALMIAAAWLCVLLVLGWVSMRAAPLRALVLATALGVVAMVLLLALLPAGEIATALAPLSRNLASLEPGRSGLPPTERIALLARLAGLALSGEGGAAVLLGGTGPQSHAVLRGGLLLTILVLGAAIFAFRRNTTEDSRPMMRGLLITTALLAAHLPLALAFGDRLWVHHLVAVPILMAALLGFALQAIPARRHLAVLALLVLPLGVLAAWDRSVVLSDLERSGGVGLASEALTRFSRDVLTATPQAAVHAPDWGILMPFVMVTRGAVAITDSAAMPAMAAQICAGRPVVLALLGADAEGRLAAYVEALWPATLRRYDQLDGTPVLWSATWTNRECRTE